MPFNLLLLPLLGGCLLVSGTHLLAFRAAKQSGERLIFAAASVAVVLLVCARIVTLLLLEHCPHTGTLWRWLAPWDYSGTATGALLLGVFAPQVINRIVGLEEASRRAVQEHGDGLDRLLFEATEREIQLVVTLATGKVYAGWLDWTPPNPGAADAYLRILPTMSGYRTLDHRIQWTTFYQAVYLALGPDTAEPDLQAFTKVIPINQIVTAGLFDPETYDRFNPGDQSTAASPGAEHTGI